MRKFQKRGKISRKKMMRKVASGEQRQVRPFVSFSHMSVPLMLQDYIENNLVIFIFYNECAERERIYCQMLHHFNR